MHRLIQFLIVICLSGAVVAQNADQSTKVTRPLLNEYEGTSESPYGRLNPNAPPETAQFGFMVGTFDCTDRLREPKSGKWFESEAVWSSRYILNGYGIEDRYWSPIIVAQSTRIFDAKKKKWIVTYLQSIPSYQTGVWEGVKEGNNMVMRRAFPNSESRLTFSNITETGFDWIGENVTKEKTTSGWQISCKRRKN